MREAPSPDEILKQYGDPVADEPPPGAASGEFEQAAQVIERLASLPPLEYERERKAAAKRLGLPVAALDRFVKAEQRKRRKGAGARDEGAFSGDLALSDFVALMPLGRFIFKPTGAVWPAQSVDSRVPPIDPDGVEPMAASAWLSRNAAVEQMTWAPGEEQLIHDRLVSDGGWIARPGCTAFNLYRPPVIAPSTENPAPWLEHVRAIYLDEFDHIVGWCAHRVQRPQEKINHALVLGGRQGIGKDTILEPIKSAVGPWNFMEVSPTQVIGRFNGHLKSVVLRVSEARDLGDVDRFAFYEHMKAVIAAPPDVQRVDEKFLPEYGIPNVCGVVITTNNKVGGLYLPEDDRRHFIAWSGRTKDDFAAAYWSGLYDWLDRQGGREAVAGFLHRYDLSGFDPKAPPPHTPAFYEIASASRASEDDEMADTLDALGWPKAVTVADIKQGASAEFRLWLDDRKNRKAIAYRLETNGYTLVRNPHQKEGRWKVGGRNTAIYASDKLTDRERRDAAERLANWA
ncbi:hypothetical protein BB934_00100 [Microvirga ossetica]|uniref:NrS-1 polymerase-like helicase domain-containing protein n=1 Tax=Microvirga ossetica TaxID=1882682 RepID=A0A1B2EA13_9HYPH|nr:primase-helicase family protein [Microvirga ossetica]ANY76816.1 hypothetical protein BB934_00100 [Microvirga ossetica]